MANIIPISGEIKSQPLNDNFSALNSDLANSAKTNSVNTFLDAQTVERPLGGSHRPFYRMVASDGKTYEFLIRTDGSFSVWNSTDSLTVARFGPSHEMYIGSHQVWSSSNFNVESGSFTAFLESDEGPGNDTFSYNNGYYKKIDNIVYFQIDFAINVFDSNHTGFMKINGLPFVSNSIKASVVIGRTSIANAKTASIFQSSNYINLYNGVSGVSASDFANGSVLTLSGSYATI